MPQLTRSLTFFAGLGIAIYCAGQLWGWYPPGLAVGILLVLLSIYGTLRSTRQLGSERTRRSR